MPGCCSHKPRRRPEIVRHSSIRLPPRDRRWAYAILSALVLSGAAHFVLRQYFPATGEFGPEPSPAEPWLLRLHGAAAMATLLLLGALWPTHIRPGLADGRNRRAGVTLLAVAAALVVSGYGLYYASGDGLRGGVRWAHLGFGFAAIPAYALHLHRGRASRRRSVRSTHRHPLRHAHARHDSGR